MWGYAESPLIDGAKVIVTPGGDQGALVALNKKTGAVIWQTKDFTDSAHYSSVIISELGGVRQYIQLTPSSIAGIAAAQALMPDAAWLVLACDLRRLVDLADYFLKEEEHESILAGWGTGMAAALRMIRGVVRQAGDDGDVLAERLQRLEYPRVSKIGARLRRLPILHDDAVRDIHHGDAAGLFRALHGGSQRRAHGVENR